MDEFGGEGQFLNWKGRIKDILKGHQNPISCTHRSLILSTLGVGNQIKGKKKEIKNGADGFLLSEFWGWSLRKETGGDLPKTMNVKSKNASLWSETGTFGQTIPARRSRIENVLVKELGSGGDGSRLKGGKTVRTACSPQHVIKNLCFSKNGASEHNFKPRGAPAGTGETEDGKRSGVKWGL